ncbi:DNA photolyase family protein [Actinotalea sp. M2MS4P-6]|uniref:cryptochrome/photolyase family protein n=1 Tax=Actinotalea sp. M2MS4P-6 TaxID=2983762 RepID=UPI0021E48B52|nr:deoxyribodipyrimidine photo-lyase [Actinotalea sp. M2MS4P-6]MCV2392881.1 DNA photolyase family protein [Actinotalea sp. M2MS4P-6]
MTSILWLRRDLRLRDHPALGAAVEAAVDDTVVPVFVLDPGLLEAAGPARVGALREALAGVADAVDGALVVRRGRPEDVLPTLVREARAGSVHVSAETTPYGRRRDERVGRALADLDVPLVATGSPYAVTPGRVRTRTDEPYKVFTPFSKAWREHGWRRPAQVPAALRWHRGPDSDGLPATPDGAPTGQPAVTEQAALERWHAFLEDGLEHYGERRDRPDLDGTSQLSVHLKYGTLHPRTLLADVAAHPAGRTDGARTFVTELAWREFYADVLFHAPASAWRDWRDDLRFHYDDPATDPDAAAALDAWQQGRTGYPFVDAGMRQLLATGWMHNRVRMVTASFLVKDLHQWWVHGARHFLAHLRDGDVASNNHGWQWVAGTGTDAAPYFRVFNPVTQGARFDPDGDYVRRWVPELRHLAGAAAHEPWRAADGYAHGYPERIVEHGAEREEALARYAAAKG